MAGNLSGINTLVRWDRKDSHECDCLFLAERVVRKLNAGSPTLNVFEFGRVQPTRNTIKPTKLFFNNFKLIVDSLICNHTIFIIVITYKEPNKAISKNVGNWIFYL